MPGRVDRALVTGASSGIGRAFASELAWRGVAPILVARRRGHLEDLVGRLDVDAEVLVADLTEPDDRARVEARLTSGEDPVDLLVNNAGYGAYGRMHELDLDRQATMIELNCTVVVSLTRAVLPRLVDRGTGGVINVGSTAGYQPRPHAAVYGATKAFVRSFTEAVHEEVKGGGVHVMLSTPGVAWTEFQEVAGIDPKKIPGMAWTSAEEIAAVTLRDFAARRAVSVPGTHNRVLATLADVAPSAVGRRVTSRVLGRLTDGA